MNKRTPFVIGILILTLSFPFPAFSNEKDIVTEIRLRQAERQLLEKDMAFAMQEHQYWMEQVNEKRLAWGIGSGLFGGGTATTVLLFRHYLQKRKERLAEEAAAKLEAEAAAKKLAQAAALKAPSALPVAAKAVTGVAKPVAEALVKKFGLRKVVIVAVTTGIFVIGAEMFIELDSSQDDIFERFVQRGADFHDSDEYFIREVLEYVSLWTNFNRPGGAHIANHNISNLDTILEQIGSALYEMDRSKEKRDLKYSETMAALHYAKHHVLQRKYNLLGRNLNDFIRRVKDAKRRQKRTDNKNGSLSEPLVEPGKDKKKSRAN